jgi:tRNA dimethylallyltransferase
LSPLGDPAVRSRVLREAQTHPVDVLYEWLRSRDPRRAGALSARDPYRILRALEVDLSRANDDTPEVARALPTLRAAGLPFVKLVLRVDMDTLAPRIGARTDAMLAGGLIDEAERIGVDAVAADAVGYREAIAYRRGWLTGGELRVLLARATRRYAKRQLTWFRGEPDIRWIEPGDVAAVDAAVASIGWRA